MIQQNKTRTKEMSVVEEAVISQLNKPGSFDHGSSKTEYCIEGLVVSVVDGVVERERVGVLGNPADLSNILRRVPYGEVVGKHVAEEFVVVVGVEEDIRSNVRQDREGVEDVGDSLPS